MSRSPNTNERPDPRSTELDRYRSNVPQHNRPSDPQSWGPLLEAHQVGTTLSHPKTRLFRPSLFLQQHFAQPSYQVVGSGGASELLCSRIELLFRRYDRSSNLKRPVFPNGLLGNPAKACFPVLPPDPVLRCMP